MPILRLFVGSSGHMRRVPIVGLVLLFAGAASAGEWDYRKGLEGRGYVVCDGLRKHLNSYQWTEESAEDEDGFYVWSAVASYPGWKDPPWQDLDPKQHQDLIEEMLTFRELGEIGEHRRTEQRIAQVNESVVAKVNAEYRLQLWKTRLLNWLGNGPAPEGEQYVVQLTTPPNAEELARLRSKRPDRPAIERPGFVLIATSDLKKVDPLLTQGTARQLGAVRLFKNQPHFLMASITGREVLVGKNLQVVPQTFCYLTLAAEAKSENRDESRIAS